ncbi:origin recognition complex subunit 2-domain-containing protein [Limtongia smithiae]|uniref:origin recognition complex subunit 2-domain-containing protein n=1 Tax=Limtongia smithiae TaxID=1125753 RepID=UPI0034CF1530
MPPLDFNRVVIEHPPQSDPDDDDDDPSDNGDDYDHANDNVQHVLPSDDELVAPVTPTKPRKRTAPNTALTHSPKKPYVDKSRNYAIVLDGAEGYFDQHLSKSALSTNLISTLPYISQQEYARATRHAEEHTASARRGLEDGYTTRAFAQWRFELVQGFNVLLYGLGSKRELALKFVNEQCGETADVLVVNGYNPSITIRDVLLSIAQALLDTTRVRLPRSIPDALAVIMKSASASTSSDDSCSTNITPANMKLILLIHNIDGASFRNDRTHSVFARLARHPYIRIVATVDHINAPLLWDSAKLSSLRFIWHDASTFAAYTVETSFADWAAIGPGRGKGMGGNRTADAARDAAGIRYVLESLTSNARGLYRVLIAHQLQSMVDAPSQDSSDPARYGMESKQLYQQCSEEFIATNELNFRTMLTEFLEHEMLASTKDQLGTEIIYSPLGKDMLERFLEEDILS